MSGTLSCKQCGCSEIDTDPARGDAVCTNCGCVLEESIIVSEVTFEEDGHGGASAIGQFVSAESRGGGILSATGGGGFHTSVGKESREITLRNAKKRINEVAQQLRLNQHCIDVAFNFFKMALHKQLTKGRKNSLTIAACIYMTCRIEGTPHLLIDFSDVLQMDVYALGRAYVQISRSLYINIPAVDPCMYILRFAHKFELGDKTHEVAMTSLRLVQRMKRDWIHLGRRPSGLCGAALLISARLHNFSRSVQDVIRVVKVHETTLRKRLVEFGETPSSSLTLDEFMSVDLEEEHDPPSYKAARIKDRERLQKLLDANVSEEFKQLQGKIDEELERRRRKLAMSKSGGASPAPSQSPRSEPSTSPSPVRDNDVENNFIIESTLTAINSIISDKPTEKEKEKDQDRDRILMPPPAIGVNPIELHNKLALESSAENAQVSETETCQTVEVAQGGELDLDGIDDNEINGYIMSNVEVQRKTVMWENINKEYIESQKLKMEQMEKDIREGKVDKKKRKKNTKTKPTFQAKSANEAIKIMLKERKISSKINYEVLRSLTAGMDTIDEVPSTSQNATQIDPVTVIESGPIIPQNYKRKLEIEPEQPSNTTPSKKSKSRRRSSASVCSVSSDKEVEILPVDRKPVKVQLESDSESEETVVVDPDSKIQVKSSKDAPIGVAEVVVESGVIQYNEIHEEDEDEMEDEEETSLSARHLLTQFRGEDDNEDDEYYD